MNEIHPTSKCVQVLTCLLALSACAFEATHEGDDPSDVAATPQALSSGDQAWAHYNGSTLVSNYGPIQRFERLEQGRYRFRTPSFWDDTYGMGQLQVVAIGTTNYRCKAEDLFTFDLIKPWAYVRCHDVAGNLKDSPFVVHWSRYHGAYSNRGAYVRYSGSPRAVAESFNSTGAWNTVSRIADGQYQVLLPNLAKNGGTVQVTALEANRTHCKVAGWGPSGSAQLINVRCFAGSTPANASFFVNYDERVTSPYGNGAHVWAHGNAGLTPYTPSAAWSFNSGMITGFPGVNTAGHFGAANSGRFWISHTLQGYSGPPAAIPHVTAYGSGKEYCKLETWFRNLDVVEVRTRCFDENGLPKDTQYVETYAQSNVLSPI